MLRLILLGALLALPARAESGAPWQRMAPDGRITDARAAEPGCGFPLWRCGLQGNPRRAMVEYRGTQGCTRTTGLPLPRPAALRQEASLRREPSTQAEAIALLDIRAAVTILDECHLWRRVRSARGEGWVHAATLRATAAP